MANYKGKKKYSPFLIEKGEVYYFDDPLIKSKNTSTGNGRYFFL